MKHSLLIVCILILSSCEEGKITFKNMPTKTTSTVTEEAGFPVGAVVAFNSISCPADWTLFAPAKGRGHRCF